MPKQATGEPGHDLESNHGGPFFRWKTLPEMVGLFGGMIMVAFWGGWGSSQDLLVRMGSPFIWKGHLEGEQPYLGELLSMVTDYLEDNPS